MSLHDHLKRIAGTENLTEPLGALFKDEFGLDVRRVDASLASEVNEIFSPNCAAVISGLRIVGFVCRDSIDDAGLANPDGDVPVVFTTTFSPGVTYTPREYIVQITQSLSRYWSRLTSENHQLKDGPVVVAGRYDLNSRAMLSLSICSRRQYANTAMPGMAAGEVAVIHDIQLTGPSDYHKAILQNLHVTHRGSDQATFQQHVAEWLNRLACSDTVLLQEVLAGYWEDNHSFPPLEDAHTIFGQLGMSTLRLRYTPGSYLAFLRDALPEYAGAIDNKVWESVCQRQAQFEDLFGHCPPSRALVNSLCCNGFRLCSEIDIERLAESCAEIVDAAIDRLGALREIREECNAWMAQDG